MRGNNNRTLGQIIKRLMRNPKLSERLDNLDAIDAWKEIIGSPLFKYIIDQKVYKGILYVRLRSAVVRNELSYKKLEFIQQINERIGRKVITDIVLK